MHKKLFILIPLASIITLFGCGQQSKYHQSSLPEPSSYNAHFGDLDTDGNDWVSWDELKAHFPQANPEVFEALDLNQDSRVDHDEWHAFKEAHGMRHHN